MLARRLSTVVWHAEAEGPMNAVFRPLTKPPFHQPFQDKISARLIIDCGDGFDLDERQFHALSAAATDAGDSNVFYSFVRSGPECASYYTWELPLWDYDAYMAVLDDKDFFLPDRYVAPLDRVFFSPTGRWGILLPELYAVVGGSPSFVQRFKQEYPSWQADLEEFVAGFERARRKGVDTSWVPELLEHVLGSDAPPEASATSTS